MLITIAGYAISFCILVGIGETLLSIYVQRRFKYRLPRKGIENKWSRKQLRMTIKSGEIANGQLLIYLRIILILDTLLRIAGILILSVFLLSLIMVVF